MVTLHSKTRIVCFAAGCALHWPTSTPALQPPRCTPNGRAFSRQSAPPAGLCPRDTWRWSKQGNPARVVGTVSEPCKSTRKQSVWTNMPVAGPGSKLAASKLGREPLPRIELKDRRQRLIVRPTASGSQLPSLLAGQFEVRLLSSIELLGELEFPSEVVISRLAELGARRV
jgi:hypothetical protein